MKPFKARGTRIIFKLINVVPWIFRKRLVEQANYYLSDRSKSLRDKENNFENCSFLEGDFSWKAVGVVVRVDHFEFELIRRWMKNNAPPGDYNPKFDNEFFSTKFVDRNYSRPLGWISFREKLFHKPLMEIDLPESLCKYCFISFNGLPNGFTYLSMYFFLLPEATSKIKYASVCEIERYVNFQSLNPFSKRFKIIEHHGRSANIIKFIKNNLNLVLEDVKLATTQILNTWRIKKNSDQLITVADFYRDSDTSYFFTPDIQQNHNEVSRDSETLFVLLGRNDYFCDSGLSSDPCENYCVVREHDGYHLDAFFIKSQSHRNLKGKDNFAEINLDISESHLFLSLLLDCHNQYKNIANYATVALLPKNNIDLEVRYKILFDSLLKLDSLHENILAIEKHINFACMEEYKVSSKEIIQRLQENVQELRLSIDNRMHRSNAELKIEDIKFHRNYSRIFSILVIAQIILAALTVDDWGIKIDDLCSYKESLMRYIEFKFDYLIKEFK